MPNYDYILVKKKLYLCDVFSNVQYTVYYIFRVQCAVQFFYVKYIFIYLNILAFAMEMKVLIQGPLDKLSIEKCRNSHPYAEHLGTGTYSH